MSSTQQPRSVSFDMPFSEVVGTQRAIRRVTDEPVEDELILQLIEYGTCAPNAQNAQSWEFIVVKDQAVIDQLAGQNRFMWNLAKGSMKKKEKKIPGFEKMNKATQWAVDHFESYPAMIVACYKGGRFLFPSIVAASEYGSILPAVQNILLSARATGLGANLTTMPLWHNRKARKILGLPGKYTPSFLITLGWPRGRYGVSNRKPVGDVVSLNRFGERPWQGQSAAQASEQA